MPPVRWCFSIQESVGSAIAMVDDVGGLEVLHEVDVKIRSRELQGLGLALQGVGSL